MSTMPNVPRSKSSQSWLESAFKKGFSGKPGQRKYQKLGYEKVAVSDRILRALPNPIWVDVVSELMRVIWTNSQSSYLLQVEYFYVDRKISRICSIPAYVVAKFVLQGKWATTTRSNRPFNIVTTLIPEQHAVLQDFVNTVEKATFRELQKKIEQKHPRPTVLESRANLVDLLSNAQCRVAFLTAEGMSTEAIETILNRSRTNIFHHLSKIFDLWGRSSRYELIAFVQRKGLLEELRRRAGIKIVPLFKSTPIRVTITNGPGKKVVCEFLLGRIGGRAKQLKRQYVLTTRQVETIKIAADGASDAEIAKALGIHKYTAKRHLSDIYRRLKISSRRELAVFANMYGFDEIELGVKSGV